MQLLEEGKLGFVTKVHGAKVLLEKNCSTLQSLSLKELNYTTTATSFNQDGSLLAIANGSALFIISTQTKVPIQTLRSFDGDISLLHFLTDSKYLIAGTTSGRLLEYRYDARLQISRLCSFGYADAHKSRAKERSVTAFTHYDKLIAAGNSQGEIIALKRNSSLFKEHILTENAAIVALAYLNASQLVSANAKGQIFIHTLAHPKKQIKIDSPFTCIHKFVLVPNTDYLLLCGDAGKLAIINTKLGKIFRANFLSFTKEITDIHLTKEGELLLTLEHKEIKKVILPTQEDLKQDILHNRLHHAFEKIEYNPMLRGTREHKRIEVLYEKLYTQAIDALAKHDAKEARKLLKNFSHIEEKKADITAMFQSFEKYQQFIHLSLEKKYALAYGLIQKYPALKYTPQYKKMEDGFKEAYTLAQKQVLLGHESLARDILSPYITTLSKRPLIQLILKNNKDFLAFLEALNKEDFTTIEKLLEKNEIFTQIPTLQKLYTSTQKSLESIKKSLTQGDDVAAMQQIQQLEHINNIQEQLQQLKQAALHLKELKDAYEENDFVRCYEILDTSEYLEEYKLSQLLEKHYTQLIESCETLALRGDIAGVQESFDTLINIKTRSEKIGSILRLAYQVKIKYSMAKRKIGLAEHTIYEYIDIFGEDNEIRLMMKSFEYGFKRQLALSEHPHQRLPRDAWQTTLASSQ